ncbi:MAG: N-acetylmuramoyl-L-alanine amidase [Xanthomonadales bacterium]|nr:N-acetylmuramoyl-L-alanine amidase [Xanthomonadales bacterium]NIX12208.1 N-acetylmuramoyl-L-alanine amidase [Xanthomonadales bacterium]
MRLDFAAEAPLSYASRLQRRAPEDIDLVVIHCTELPDLETAREFGERVHYPGSGTGNCGHLYIDRDGRTEAWAGLARVAHHTRGFNERSIGIELVNEGRWPDWLHSERQVMTDPYPGAQIEALVLAIDKLSVLLPGLHWIAGHDELDRERVPASDDPELKVFRKRDPGPLFPWDRVLSSVSLRRFPG